MKLYDLCGADGLRFSPFGWKVRMAIAHKGLTSEVETIHFADRERLAFSGQSLLPVLVDGAAVIADSFAIALYLEQAYPSRPSLFGSEMGKGMARFINVWVDQVVITGLARLLMRDILAAVAPCDRAYFRASREAAFGETAEQMHERRDERLVEFRASLEPLRSILRPVPAPAARDGAREAGTGFVCGSAPGYADYAAFAAFRFAQLVSDFEILDNSDPIQAWCAAMPHCRNA